jgi:hypothetical protein
MTGAAPVQSVKRRSAALFRTLVMGLAIYGGLDLARGVVAQDEESLYLPVVVNAAQVESLETRVAALEYKLQHVTASTDAITVTGANLWVVNGTGGTDAVTNGLGNVIIGYNETGPDPLWHSERSGSHMLVVGKQLNYTGCGGVVAGVMNVTSAAFASVIGGSENKAYGTLSAVFGGWGNEAYGEMDVASGGVSNMAYGGSSVAVGGQANRAEGFLSTALGGDSSTALGWASSVVGGRENVASGYYAAVSGGRGNTASGDDSSVSGGHAREAAGEYSWRAGDLFQPN